MNNEIKIKFFEFIKHKYFLLGVNLNISKDYGAFEIYLYVMLGFFSFSVGRLISHEIE